MCTVDTGQTQIKRKEKTMCSALLTLESFQSPCVADKLEPNFKRNLKKKKTELTTDRISSRSLYINQKLLTKVIGKKIDFSLKEV